MKLSIISFTENGKKLAEYIAEQSDEMETETGTIKTTVGDWAERQMQEKNALLFIGACGIAVRAVAPYITDKLHDSPVLVMDERGRYVIPILSGHMGGANELAEYLAKKTGAEPVITTATDINGKFAVDVFARRNGLYIVNKDGIAKVSAKALAGKTVTVSIEEGHCTDSSRKGKVPYPPAGPVDVIVTSEEEKQFDALIWLKPKEYIIGFGCRKGKTSEEIDCFIRARLELFGISMTQISALASISQKQDEEGIVRWCRRERIPFVTYTAEELKKTEGSFEASAFVEAQVGVDNVCERAAMKACGASGKLIYRKYAEDGMTIAVAKREWKVRLYEE